MFLKCKNCVLIELSFLHEEGTQAPVDSIEFRLVQNKYLKGTGASTSLRSIAPLVYLSCGEERFYSVRRNKGLVLSVA